MELQAAIDETEALEAELEVARVELDPATVESRMAALLKDRDELLARRRGLGVQSRVMPLFWLFVVAISILIIEVSS